MSVHMAGKIRGKYCATCGRFRANITPQRRDWGLSIVSLIPRVDDVEGKPWQQTNDLLCHASIYRNGGTNEECHLCDDCLAVGLRALKVAISSALDESCGDAAEIVRLTEELGSIQHRVKETEILRRAGIPDYAWNHTDFLEQTAELWRKHARQKRESCVEIEP